MPVRRSARRRPSRKAKNMRKKSLRTRRKTSRFISGGWSNEVKSNFDKVSDNGYIFDKHIQHPEQYTARKSIEAADERVAKMREEIKTRSEYLQSIENQIGLETFNEELNNKRKHADQDIIDLRNRESTSHHDNSNNSVHKRPARNPSRYY